MFSSYHKALYEAAAISIDPALKDFENKFAPVPPPQDNTWLQILLDFIPLGGTAIGGAFFKSCKCLLPPSLRQVLVLTLHVGKTWPNCRIS